jgi:ribosomal protein S18 acetylase RimI-like enzyme
MTRPITLDPAVTPMTGQALQVGTRRERPRNPVTIRMLREEDLPALQRLSPPKPPVEFRVYVTLVAEIDGVIAGYTQFALTPDGTLHSFAFRVGAEWTGRGIGQRLLAEEVALAKAAGAKFHIYAVDAEGKDALQAILRKQGMHRCHTLGDVVIYAASLTHKEPHDVRP